MFKKTITFGSMRKNRKIKVLAGRELQSSWIWLLASPSSEGDSNAFKSANPGLTIILMQIYCTLCFHDCLTPPVGLCSPYPIPVRKMFVIPPFCNPSLWTLSQCRNSLTMLYHDVASNLAIVFDSGILCRWSCADPRTSTYPPWRQRAGSRKRQNMTWMRASKAKMRV
jgi:hypothetical protein